MKYNNVKAPTLALSSSGQRVFLSPFRVESGTPSRVTACSIGELYGESKRHLSGK